ncbi:MAG: 2-oxo acid dehydrogenase subunit E2, partial [Candidatus Helarchaeota archaeon]|nr:2-oxo acid dehydrogenase subunit E2 [Candidatus Helarchaeota archaeon]
MKEEIYSSPEFEDIPLSGIRKVMSHRLIQSKAPIPHFYLTTEIDMEKIISLRKSLHETIKDVKITYNDIFIKLAALTLKNHLYMTSSFRGDKIRRFKNIHIGFVVAIDDGIITPIIKDCDKKNIKDIALESKSLIEKARIKKLKRNEYEGAVFTISNLGMYDIENFSAVINPPEGSILAIGSIIKKPTVINDQIKIRHRMKVTISCDHRTIDGAVA